MYRGTITFRNTKKIREWVQVQGVVLLRRQSISITGGKRMATWECEMDETAYNKVDVHWYEFEWSLEKEK